MTQITAGPAGDRIPERLKSPTPPTPRELREGRPVVLDRPAERDLKDLPKDVLKRLLVALDAVEEGKAHLEPKQRDLTGAFSLRLNQVWRAVFYFGREKFWHLFAITEHDYNEVSRRFASIAEAGFPEAVTAVRRAPGTLFHYTSEMHLPHILAAGHLRLTESNISISGAGPGVVWLTTTPTGDGNGVYGFKSAVKITLTPPPTTFWWPEWSREQGIEDYWYDALAQAADGDPENWWVCTNPIPLSWVEKIEVNGRVLPQAEWTRRQAAHYDPEAMHKGFSGQHLRETAAAIVLSAEMAKTADEDQCPHDASDSVMVDGDYVCEEGHRWHPDDPAAQAYHGDGPERGKIQPTAGKYDTIERTVVLDGTTFVLSYDPIRPITRGGPRSILATTGGGEAGYLTWDSRNIIGNVGVKPAYQRRGLATAMLEMAREIVPGLQHSHARTPDGEAWSQAVGSKTAAAGRWYHIADKADFRLNPRKEPALNRTLPTTLKPGIFLTQNPEAWGSNYGYRRPFIVEFDVPAEAVAGGIEGTNEIYVPAEFYPQMRIVKVHTWDGFVRDRWHSEGPVESMTGTNHVTGEPLVLKGNRMGEPWYEPPGPGVDARSIPADRLRQYVADFKKWRRTQPKGFALSSKTAMEYRLQHQAPVEGYDVTQMAEAFPDVLEHPEWYCTPSAPYSRQAVAVMREMAGKPGSTLVDIYRALPVEHRVINTGDWVTTSLEYAQMHAEGEPFHVIHARVPARYVITEGNDIHEFGYAGPTLSSGSVREAAKTAAQPGVYYHVTSYENWPAIRSGGLRPGADGHVWLFTETEAAMRFKDAWDSSGWRTGVPPTEWNKPPCIVVVRTDRAVPTEAGIPGAYWVEGPIGADEVYDVIRPGDLHHYAKTAVKARPANDPIQYRHLPPRPYPGEPERSGGHHTIKAMLNGKQVGYLTWWDPEDGPYKDSTNFGPKVNKVEVASQHRRQGIAAEMLRRAREITPRLRHSDELTSDGRAWRDGVSPNEAGQPARPARMNPTLGERTALPSWRDRGERPECEALIVPDTGRARGNSYEVYLYGQPHARRSTLAEAKAVVEEIYGPQEWKRLAGDEKRHHDEVWGPTTMFNDASVYYVVERLPRLGAQGGRGSSQAAGSVPERHRREGSRGVLAMEEIPVSGGLRADQSRGSAGVRAQAGVSAAGGSDPRGGVDPAHLRHASVSEPDALADRDGRGQSQGRGRAGASDLPQTHAGIHAHVGEVDRRAGAGDARPTRAGRTTEGARGGVLGERGLGVEDLPAQGVDASVAVERLPRLGTTGSKARRENNRWVPGSPESVSGIWVHGNADPGPISVRQISRPEAARYGIGFYLSRPGEPMAKGSYTWVHQFQVNVARAQRIPDFGGSASDIIDAALECAVPEDIIAKMEAKHGVHRSDPMIEDWVSPKYSAFYEDCLDEARVQALIIENTVGHEWLMVRDPSCLRYVGEPQPPVRKDIFTLMAPTFAAKTAAIPLTCSACGEIYFTDSIEGEKHGCDGPEGDLHDHWTEASRRTAAYLNYSAAEAMYGIGFDRWVSGGPVMRYPSVMPYQEPKIDREAVKDQTRPSQRRFEMFDPRYLISTQIGVTKQGVGYYANSEEYKRTGRTYADQDLASNEYPIFYRDSLGVRILSGHHRSVAALITGEKIRAVIVEGPTSPNAHPRHAHSVPRDAAARIAAVLDGEGGGADHRGRGHRGAARGGLGRGAEGAGGRDRLEDHRDAAGGLGPALSRIQPTGWWHACSPRRKAEVEARGGFPADYAPRNANWGPGVYLINDDDPSIFGKAIVEVRPEWRNPFIYTPTQGAGLKDLIPHLPGPVRETLLPAYQRYQRNTWSVDLGEEFREAMLAHGYDGLIVNRSGGEKWAVVFEPEKAKVPAPDLAMAAALITAATAVQQQAGTPLDYRGQFGGRATRFFVTEPGYTGPTTGNWEGATPDTVAYLDVFEQGDWVDIAFMTTRDDRQQQGLATALVTAAYDALAPKKIYWGRLMHDGAEALKRRFRSTHRERTGSKTAWSPFRPPEGMKITSGGDAVPGGYNGYYVAWDAASGEKLGYLDYQSAKIDGTDHVTIAMVEVEPQHRRKGVGATLYEALRHDFSDAVFDPGMTTPDGARWWEAVEHRFGSKTAVEYGGEFDPAVEGWRPTAGMFAPGQDTLDPRLFEGDRMRPEVVSTIMSTLAAYWDPKYPNWRTWARVYLAGSGASYWWDSDADLDILIGIDLDALRADRPANREVADEDVLAALNAGLQAELRPTTTTLLGFEATWFCNPGAYDIRAIHPYAAYEISADAWVVHPPVLPADWGPASIPEETWRRCEQAAREAEEVLSLPEPERSIAGTVFFNWIKDGRKAAYSANGGGWLDPGNVIYQYLTQHPHALLRRLYLCKHPEKATAAEGIERTAGPAKDYLDMVTKMMATSPLQPGRFYRTVDEIIRAHGKQWRQVSPERPRGVRKGRVNDCYGNALRAVQADPSLIYVEGYATPPGLFPMKHAWVVDGNGVVYDVTWDTPGEDYFGVPFETDWVERYVGRSGWTSVFGTDVVHDGLVQMLLKGLPDQAMNTTGAAKPLPEGLAFRPAPRSVVYGKDGIEAVVQGEVAGFLYWSESAYWEDEQGRPEIEIGIVFVQPEYRRRGIATALLEEALRVEPRIQHSEVRSRDGDAWAKSLGHPLPEQHFLDEQQRQEWHRRHGTKTGARTGTFWRVHPEGRAFGDWDATSKPFFGPGEEQQGYSCFENPWHLYLYVKIQWANLNDSATILRFPGERVGTGADGEDLAVPTALPFRTTWGALKRMLPEHPLPDSPVFAPWVSQRAEHRTWKALAQHWRWLDMGEPEMDFIVRKFSRPVTSAKHTVTDGDYAGISFDYERVHRGKRNGQEYLLIREPSSVTARTRDGRSAGYLTVVESTNEIGAVNVMRDHQRQGLATAMLEMAREDFPGLGHTTVPGQLSPAGEAWSKVVGVRVASLAGNLDNGAMPAKEGSVTPEHLLVRDESTNNLHLAKEVDGEVKALCNARYRVWEYGTLASDQTGENAWSWNACERCLKKADQGIRRTSSTEKKMEA